MAAPTVNVTVNVFDQSGAPVAGELLTVTLDRPAPTAIGYVTPRVQTFTADTNGIAIMPLWPNELGTIASSYRVKAKHPTTGKTLFDVTATVPNANSQLSLVANQPVYPGKSQGQLALDAAVAAVAPAVASAAAAANSETNAATSATNAAASQTAAGTSATNAATSETNAAGSATGAATSATNASGSATAAATSATNSAGSATAAAASQTAAATSATNAATSASAASTSEAAAAASETNTLAYWNNINTQVAIPLTQMATALIATQTIVVQQHPMV